MKGDTKIENSQHRLIVFFDHGSQVDDFVDKHLQTYADETAKIRSLGRGQFVIPGFIDTHIHAPQYPNSGKGLDVGLLDWLETYTFPTESRFKDAEFAEDTYDRAVRKVLLNGTTTACYYGTIHTDACLKLCDIIDKYGQRAFVGKVNMNQNSPDYYVESTDESLKNTERFVEEVIKRQYTRIRPVITPRFAISCDSTLMSKLAILAKARNIHIQTHLSETKGEMEWVQQLYPENQNYTDVYDSAGLLGVKTILAHCIYLSSEERQTIKSRGCGISHCPNSNTSLRSGVCNVKQLLDEGLHVGLGTDCSGGYSTSMLDAIRCSLHVSNFYAIQEESTRKSTENAFVPISHREAFMMATLGGAKVIGQEDSIGSFAVGKKFDALLVDVYNTGTQIDIFDDDTPEDIFQKFIYLGNEQNFTDIYVDGINVKATL